MSAVWVYLGVAAGLMLPWRHALVIALLLGAAMVALDLARARAEPNGNWPSPWWP